MRKRSIIPILYIAFLMLPIYWLVAMSFKTTQEILGGFSLFPQTWTLDSYRTIFTDPTWYWGYINSIAYVTINTVISVTVALPAAYAFSRYRFLGDKQLFFWLLTNRMAPAAVFALPFFQLYSAVGPFRHLLGRGAGALPLQHPARRLDPWKVSWAACPRNWTRPPLSTAIQLSALFHSRIFLPTIKAGVGVAAFFCFMFSLGGTAAWRKP